jgi:hypothetical protein
LIHTPHNVNTTVITIFLYLTKILAKKLGLSGYLFKGKYLMGDSKVSWFLLTIGCQNVSSHPQEQL